MLTIIFYVVIAISFALLTSVRECDARNDGGDEMLPELAVYNVPRKNSEEPVIFFVTPTHKYHAQLVDLTRMSQFLQLASKVRNHNIYWIVVEDRSDQCSPQIRQLLQRSDVPFAHLFRESTYYANAQYGFKVNKGINQRNRAMDALTDYYKQDRPESKEAVLYFADGDNAYDLRLVAELVQTKAVSVFPVGFTAKKLYERCVVDGSSGKVIGFVGWWGGRKFPVDMAGFALSLELFLSKAPRFKQSQRMGHLESNFLSEVVDDMSHLQPLATNCTKVYVWHTKTDPRLSLPKEQNLSHANPGDSRQFYDRLKEEI